MSVRGLGAGYSAGSPDLAGRTSIGNFGRGRLVERVTFDEDSSVDVYDQPLDDEAAQQLEQQTLSRQQQDAQRDALQNAKARESSPVLRSAETVDVTGEVADLPSGRVTLAGEPELKASEASTADDSLYDDVPQLVRQRESSEEGEEAADGLTGYSGTSALQRTISGLMTPAATKAKKAADDLKAKFADDPSADILNNLHPIGRIPELGREDLKRANYAPEEEKKGYDKELAYLKKVAIAEPVMRYTYRQRINKINDPAMDPSNPLYNYDKWFDNFILKTKLTRLIKPENFRASNDGMYYPYDYRRYVVRSPLMNPNVYAWINDASDAKLDPAVVRNVKKELEELQRKSRSNPRNLVYAPDGDAIDAKENFDLMHLSDQYMAHEYADLDKLKAYLAGNHPFGTHLKELTRRVMNKVLERMPSRRSPPQNPWTLHGFDGEDIARLKNMLNRHRRKPQAGTHSPHTNPVGPYYDSVLDLHRLLYKTAPRDAQNIFGAQIDEMQALRKFTAARQYGEPWEMKALRDIRSPKLKHSGASMWAPATPYEPMPASPHYKTSTFDVKNDVLSVLPEAARIYPHVAPAA